MNEIDLALKQTGLIVFLVLAVLLPFKIKFSENYLIVYIVGVAFGCCVYAGLLFGFDVQPVGESLSRVVGEVSEKISKKLEPLHNEDVQEYVSDVYAKIKKEIKFISKKDGSNDGQSAQASSDLGDFFNIDPKQLMDLSGIEDMIRSLKAKDLYTDEIKDELDRLKKFILNSQTVYPK
jgi:hypothetical protein